MVRAPDLKSFGARFKSRSDRLLMLFREAQVQLPSCTCTVNSLLVCLLAVAILKPSYVHLNIYLSLFVCIGPEKPQYGVAN